MTYKQGLVHQLCCSHIDVPSHTPRQAQIHPETGSLRWLSHRLGLEGLLSDLPPEVGHR